MGTIRKTLPLSAGAIAAALLSAGCATGFDSRSISVSAVQRLRAPMSFADVQQHFGPATQGHGPYRWYPCAWRPGRELWFWYALPKPHHEAKSDAEIGVAYVTITTEANPEKQRFVWPISATKLDAMATLKELYREIQ